MGKIIWTPQAQKDLRAIYDYIANDSRRYALREVHSIKERTDILQQYQEAGKLFIALDDPSVRELVYSHYRIIYKIVSDQRVDIITVHHGSRSIPKRKLKF